MPSLNEHARYKRGLGCQENRAIQQFSAEDGALILFVIVHIMHYMDLGGAS